MVDNIRKCVEKLVELEKAVKILGLIVTQFT